jgi:hypothetical protein
MKPVPPTIRTRPLVVVGVVGDDVAAGAIALLLELIVTMLVCKMEGS